MAQPEVTCPECLTRFKISESLIGKKGRCRHCGHIFMLEAPDEDIASVYGFASEDPLRDATGDTPDDPPPDESTNHYSPERPPSTLVESEADTSSHDWTCPHCDTTYASGAAICVRCGYNHKTGAMLHTATQDEAKPPTAPTPPNLPHTPLEQTPPRSLAVTYIVVVVSVMAVSNALVVLLSTFGVISTGEGPAASLSTGSCIALVMQVLILGGVAAKSRLVWSLLLLSGGFCGLLCGVPVTALLALPFIDDFHRRDMHDLTRPEFIMTAVVAASSLLWIGVLICCLRRSCKRYFELHCPSCGRFGAPADFTWSQSHCKRCQNYW